MIKDIRHLVLGIDFDGTIIDKNDWPNAINLLPNAKEVINKLHDELNCEIIIWTCRDNTWDNDLSICKEFLLKNDIHYDYINENSYYMQSIWHNNPRKIFADIYIDDKAMLGREINWQEIYQYIINFKRKYSSKFI